MKNGNALNEMLMRRSACVASLILACCVMQSISLAQMSATPGEDPILLTRKVASPMGPALAQARSTPMTPAPVTPAWLEAKVARLEAKAWAFDAGKLITDRNLLAAASSDGLRKVCIQDIGSSVSAGANAASGTGMLNSSEPQIVVLKGDVVNICR